ncbi:sodium:solute symporter family protein [Kitasatospora sp. CMC57]|uniref:Sodium:solute symporter family protein n=1 Tax=Kitasatospora sp. CMC57 TaxID=3231513 RepID=A0AB33KAU2_9ACTN
MPALLFTVGGAGFFPVAYSNLVWPIIFVFLPRLWSVSRRHDYVTPADFVRGRYGSRVLSIAVAVTGILATMPYIALQLVGIQAVLDVMGLAPGESAWARDVPLFVAFAVLAAYTYASGLRAPALIAFVKDALIYLVVIVSVLYVPARLGGWGQVFDTAAKQLPQTQGNTVLDPASGVIPYMTLALGSAMALFMYPHAQVAVLSTRSRTVVRRNIAALSAYSVALGLIALLGYLALAQGLTREQLGGNPQRAVPVLFAQTFPSWFTGLAYAAIIVGALVPAAIMSIAASNLFTRNLYREVLRPNATPAEETRVAKIVSLLVKLGALVFVLTLDSSNAVNFQLLGGVWILQTFVAVVVGLYTRWFHRWALLAGLIAGMLYGTVTAYAQSAPGRPHFAAQTAELPWLGQRGYIALTALLLNLVVASVATWLLRALGAPDGKDETAAGDYHYDPADTAAPQPDPGPRATASHQ